MSIMENGYNFWVGNYSGVSRTGKVIPSGKMTKVSAICNTNLLIFCGSKTTTKYYHKLYNICNVIKTKIIILKAMQPSKISSFSI